MIRAGSIDEALRAVEAICNAGIPVVEITMTVPDAPQLISNILKRTGGTIMVGAGTVTSAGDARRCVDAGAKFLVSPGHFGSCINNCQSAGNPGDSRRVHSDRSYECFGIGARAIKIFPCSSGGGPKHLKDLRGPFPNVPLIPTGGVNASNAAEYIAVGAFALGAGGDLMDGAALRNGDTQSTTNAAKELLAAVQAARSKKLC